MLRNSKTIYILSCNNTCPYIALSNDLEIIKINHLESQSSTTTFISERGKRTYWVNSKVRRRDMATVAQGHHALWTQLLKGIKCKIWWEKVGRKWKLEKIISTTFHRVLNFTGPEKINIRKGYFQTQHSSLVAVHGLGSPHGLWF